MGTHINSRYSTMRKTTSVLFIYFGVIICTLLLRIAFSLGFGDWGGIDSGDVWTFIVQILIFGVMPFTLYFIINKKAKFAEIPNIFTEFGFTKPKGKHIGLSIVIALCMMFCATCIVVIWSFFLSMLGYSRSSQSTDYYNIGILFKELAFTALLPAFFEEFTHRGLLFAGLKEGKKKGIILIILTSLFFALMHQNIYQTVYTFFDGMIMGLVTYYSGSIVCGMLVHFMNNGINVLEEFLYQKTTWFAWLDDKVYDFFTGTFFGYIVAVALFTLCLAAIFVLLRFMRRDAKEDGILLEQSIEDGKYTVADKVLIGAIIAMGVAATAFTLAWGIMR